MPQQHFISRPLHPLSLILLILLFFGLGFSTQAASDPVTTSCAPCAWIASAINQTQAELDTANTQLKDALEAERIAHTSYRETVERDGRLYEQIYSIRYDSRTHKNTPDSELSSSDLERLNRLRKRKEQAESDMLAAGGPYDDAVNARENIEAHIKQLGQKIASLKNDLSVCEREMCPPVKPGAAIGTMGGGTEGTEGTTSTPPPPIDLERVSTDCVPHCTAAAEAVNTHIATLESLSKALYEAKKALAKATADKEEALEREDRIARQLLALKGQIGSDVKRRKATLEKRMENASKEVTAAAREKIKQRERIAQIEKDMEATQNDIANAKAALKSCEQTQCPPAKDDKRIGYLPGGGNFSGLNNCLGQDATQQQSLGPKPSFTENVGTSLAGGLMGSFLGGGLSGGIGGAGPGGSGGPDHTFLSKNTLKDALSPSFPFSDGSNIQLQLQPSLFEAAPDLGFPDEEDYGVAPTTASKPIPGSLIGIRINEGPVKDQGFSFTDAVLVGPDCQRHQPSGRLIYEVWQDTTFSWSIEYWRWRNGALVEHWLKMGSESWSELLGKGDLPLWVGVRFDGVTPDMLAEGGWSLVTGWTYESDGEIILQPRVFDLLPATTTVTLDDGKSIAIGGLTADTKETDAGRIPMLGDIPMVGRLFEDAASKREESELLMFITPRIINLPD